MPSVKMIDRPIWYACISAGSVVDAGVIDESGVLLTGISLVSDPDENAYLDALATAGASAPTMPPAGTELTQGEIYSYSGTLYMVRQSHTRTEHDPATVPDLFVRYRADAGAALDWCVGEQVYVGTQRMYDGVMYQCLQAHQTQSDQYPSAPGVLGVLWGVVATTPGWAVGVDYTGDNTAGAGNGDVVTYDNSEYRCLQSHTSIVTWYPTAPGIINVLWIAV